jgi:gamma-glutamylcyclotransferase (GGCT)/AIG2-like uncharacterized protein YtfP
MKPDTLQKTYAPAEYTTADAPMCTRIFVYSSLREGFQNIAYSYISKYFNFECAASIKGILRNVAGHVVCTPTFNSLLIKGDLYQLKEPKSFSWAFGQLDDYEGLSATPEEPALYHRALAPVLTENGTAKEAWVYWYIGDIREKP